MKKYILIFLILLVFINLSSNNKKELEIKEQRSIFISYIELKNYLNTDINTSKKNIKTMIKNIKKYKFNTIILQVRSFSDSIYKSSIYPWSSILTNQEGKNPGYDILDYFIKESHKESILLYAWINPYRVRLNTDIKSISTKNPAYKYINTDIIYVNNGIYYNPAKEEVINLITNGVEEIVKNYKVDGVLFDDYFYPDNNIDIKDYNKYKKNNNITLKQYHLNNVNRLIERVHKVCKKYNTKFGISPDGNIENNYNKNYADVKLWCSSNKYIDFIMPQIYYGFYNETKDFRKVIKEWENLIKSNINLHIALAFYKSGKVDKYAKSGSNEWIDNNDIIMKEILLSRNLNHYKGFALFRYDHLFNKEYQTVNSVKELENIEDIIK